MTLPWSIALAIAAGPMPNAPTVQPAPTPAPKTTAAPKVSPTPAPKAATPAPKSTPAPTPKAATPAPTVTPTPTPAPTPAPAPAPAPAPTASGALCTTDSNCPGNEICSAGTCAFPPGAVAGCTADTECKGGRVCVSGSCQDAPVAAPLAPAEEPIERATPVDTGEDVDDGWALAGGVLGLCLGVTAFGLTIGSELTKEDQNPAIPLGATATILFAGAVPIAFGGAMSARNQADVRGSVGSMITSWILYGLTLTDAIALIGVGASGIEPPTGLIASVGVLGLTSATLMSIHAFVAHGQARSKMEARRRPLWQPGAQPVLTFGRPSGMSLGFSGRF